MNEKIGQRYRFKDLGEIVEVIELKDSVHFRGKVLKGG